MKTTKGNAHQRQLVSESRTATTNTKRETTTAAERCKAKVKRCRCGHPARPAASPKFPHLLGWCIKCRGIVWMEGTVTK